MAEEIIIGKLVVESAGLDQAMLASKAAILEVEKKQKDLKAATDNLNGANEQQLETFIKNENELKKLKAEYAANQKSVLELQKASLGLDAALSQQNKTQAEATENNKKLLEARRNIDATTVEGAKAIADINAKINENNKFINTNNSELEKQKNNVGNYASITENLSGILSKQGGVFAEVRTKVEGFKSTLSASVDTVKSIQDSVVSTAKGIIGFANASNIAATQTATLTTTEVAATAATEGLAVAEGTATVATTGFASVLGVLLLPITLIIAAGLLLYNVFKDFAPVVNPIKDTIAALGAVFTVLKTVILDVVTGTKSLSNIFTGLGSEIKNATIETYKLEGAQRALKKAIDIQEVSSKRTLTRVRDLILQSKDLSKSESERIGLINTAQALEENEFKKRFKNYKEEKEIIIRRLAVGKTISEEEKQRLREGDYEFLKSIAKKRKLETSIVEDYKKNQILREDLLQEDNQIQEKAQNYKNKIIEKANAAEEKQIEKQKAQAEKNRAAELKESQNKIDILKTEANQRNLNAAQQLKLANDVFEAENALAKKSFSGSDLTKAYLENRQNLSSSILSITENEINKEQEAQQARLEKTKIVNSEVFKSEMQRAIDLADAQTLLLDKKLLTEKDYAAEIVLIEKNKQENIALITAGYEEQKKLADEKAIADKLLFEDLQFQLKLQNIEGRNATEQEIKQALLDAEYANDLLLLKKSLDDKLITEENYELKKQLVQKKYNAATIANDKIVNAIKRRETERTVQNGLNAAGALFEGSKAIAVASALFNTYQGITAELSTKAKTPYEIGLKVANVAFVAAAGFAAVKNILKTNKNSSGDASGGGATRPQTTSGTGSFVNSAKTETVARVSEKPVEQNTVVSPPVLVLETLQEVANNQQVKIQSS